MPNDTVRPVHELRALEQLADEDLVALLAAGNHDAMRVIFDRYYRVITRVALRIVRDFGEAEDVAQITFTDFYRSAKLFDARKGSLRTWLLQYTYGRSINRLQSLKARSHFNQVDLDQLEPGELAPSVGEPFDLTPEEAKYFVRQVLGSLNDKHRRIVELVCYCGLTIPEVAALTGESLGNVQHYYHRTIERLRITFRKMPKPRDQMAVAKKVSPFLQRVRKSSGTLAKEVESAKAQSL